MDNKYIGPLPFSAYASIGSWEGQVSYTFSLRITCKKGGSGQDSTGYDLKFSQCSQKLLLQGRVSHILD